MASADDRQQTSRLNTLRGMRLWNLSGALSSIYTSITTGQFATGFALNLGASNALIGFLSAAPSWGQVLQLFSPLLIERLKWRKPLCVATYSLAFVMWLPIALVPLIFVEGVRPWAMIILVAISGATIAMASPASNSWLTDLVPVDVRGRFVARQQSIAAATALIASLLAGHYLDMFPKDHRQTGFITLFIFAVAFGLASIAVWAHVPEPPKHDSEPVSPFEFITLPFRHANFRSFTFFVSLRTLAVMIAAPFFVVYMLKHLQIPNGQVAAFIACATVFSMIANPFWGYLADRFGYKPILRISSTALALVPLPWIFVHKHNYWYIIPFVQIWAGIMSAGMVLVQFNLMLKTAPLENRSVYIGFYSAVANIAAAMGAMLGGLLADVFRHVGPHSVLGHSVTNLQCVFFVSSMCRFLGPSYLKRVREEREVATRVVIEQVRSGNPLMTFWNLMRMMRSSDAATKAQVTKALGSARSLLAVDELIPLLDDSDRDVRREAARALGVIGDNRAVKPLIKKLHDPLADIVEDAAEALGKIATPESLKALLDALNEVEWSVRKRIVLALGNIGDPLAVQSLEQLLTSESDPAVLMATTEALSRIGDRRALPRLRKLLRNSAPGVGRKQLANSIGNVLGSPGEFYQLLQADPMNQDEIIARIFTTSRRRLGGRRAGSAEDREYVEVHLDAGLQRFMRRQYVAAVACMGNVGLRATRNFADSLLCAALLNHQHPVYAPTLPTPKKMGLLFKVSEPLRANFALLYGLHGESRRRQVLLEEALLAAFAFKQIVDELVRLARKAARAGNGGSGA